MAADYEHAVLVLSTFALVGVVYRWIFEKRSGLNFVKANRGRILIHVVGVLCNYMKFDFDCFRLFYFHIFIDVPSSN